MGHTKIWRYKRLWWLIFVMISLFFVSYATAQDKVVVIPLTKKAPIEPFAPLAAVSPPDSAYTVQPYGIVDNVTGLMWEKKASIYISNSWQGAWNHCQSKKSGFNDGLVDWRLPSVGELMSIVDYRSYQPAINTVTFPPGTSWGYPYWSATASDIGGDLALGVSFSDGEVLHLTKSFNPALKRCVRRLSARDSIFKNNGNGTVTDLATGRTWQQHDDNTQRAWAAADTYCQNLSLGGKTDWRLPNIKELRSIIDDRVSDPAIDKGAFWGTDASHYWSATTYWYSSGHAWYVSFYSGYVGNKLKSDDTNYVRCVR